MSMEKSSHTIGNRTRDLPAYSAVPQPTALPRAPRKQNVCFDLLYNFCLKHFLFYEELSEI